MTQHRLAGRTTLITGAGSGIGRATARLFAAEGGGLIITGRSRVRLEALREEIGTAVPIRIVQADVRDAAAWRGMLLAIADDVPIDHAIINAGIGQYGPFERSDWAELTSVLHTNIDGAFATAHAVLPSMIRRGRGSVVFISSVLGIRSIPWNAVYCATKYAVQGLADGLRLEVRRHGVHVGVVGPARTETEFFDRLYKAVPQAQERDLPTARPESVARAILAMVLHRRREMMLTPGGWALTSVGRHFPRLTDAIIARVMRSPDDAPPHSTTGEQG